MINIVKFSLRNQSTEKIRLGNFKIHLFTNKRRIFCCKYNNFYHLVTGITILHYTVRPRRLFVLKILNENFNMQYADINSFVEQYYKLWNGS
jgi:hypothetical protein